MEFEPESLARAVMESLETNRALVAFDGNQVLPDEGNICEHFVIRRDFVGKLEKGQVFDTDFYHTGCDNWLWAQAKKLGQAYKSKTAKIKHRHFSVSGGNQMDSVYSRGWSKIDQDRRVLMDKLASLEKKKPKIAVYAISKNEEKFVRRCIDSAKDADLFLLSDTGSEDDTASVAREAGAVVYDITVLPWRFDVARNASLSLVPKDVDICIALDLDEVMEPGWREEVERLWSNDTTRMRYLFDWGLGVRFMSDKIHSRRGYTWKHPCHEALTYDVRSPEHFVFTDKLIVRHLPDPTKSRGQYLELLELGVKEDPFATRHSFYYGRELTFYGKHHEAITELKRYLSLPGSTWKEERALAMKFLGDSCEAVGLLDESFEWYKKGTEEASWRKEPWLALSEACYRREVWEECRDAAKKCISLPPCSSWPVDSRVDGPTSWDMLAIASYWLGDKEEAIKSGRKALDLAPGDERLIKNVEWYESMP